MLSILYFDDETGVPHRDAETIKERLESGGTIRCELRNPPESFAELSGDNADAILIDFDLRSAKDVNYYGSTLAAEMRMRHAECPIILITRPEVLGGRSTRVESSLDLDHILYKNDIIAAPEKAITQIVDLVEGTRQLADLHGKKKSWDDVVAVSMDATEDELNELREAFPPVRGKEWDVPSMSRWLRDVIQAYPGILYNDLHASARLGISVESFRKDEVQRFFADALYTGVFHNFSERLWWTDRVLSLAKRLTLELDMAESLSEEFITAFQRSFDTSLSPSVCIVDNTSPADWVCYILQQPVKIQNSLPYHPDNRPPVMDQARVSFKAIMEEQSFDKSLVDADFHEIIEALWK